MRSNVNACLARMKKMIDQRNAQKLKKQCDKKSEQNFKKATRDLVVKGLIKKTKK